MVEMLADDVVKIVGDSNIYVILGENPIVIDTSNPSSKEWMREQLKKVVDLNRVKTVLLTHLHFDHVGGLDLFPNAAVFASKEDLEDYQSNPNLFFLENVSDSVHDMLKGARELSTAPEGVPSSDLDLEGEIDGLKVIDVPGHTRGCVAFLDEKRKILFSGDTLFENGIGRYDFENSVPEEIGNSVKKLRDLITQMNLKLAPGHDY